MYSVLYVDDEPALLEIGRIFLGGSGEFRIETATSAMDALNLPDFASFEVIVSDYQMPEMDGISFLKAVRERFGEIPFILFTGRGREEVVIEAINNGADFYLQKGGGPTAQFAELAHKIRQAVRRKAAERSLRDSERRLADIIGFLPDATFAIDRDGTVIAWNRAIEDLTGVSARDMLGRGDHEYAVPIYGSRRPLLIDLVNEPEVDTSPLYSHIHRDGISITGETDLAHPRGNQISMLVKAGPLYNRNGECVGAIESIRDITERKTLERELAQKHEELQVSFEQLAAAEEELRGQYEELAQYAERIRTNEERLAMAQALGHTGSWEYLPATGEIWASSEGLRIFGYHRDAGAVPIEEIEACIPERERVHQALVELLESGKEYDLEYAIIPTDSSARRMIHSIARLECDANGVPTRIVGVIRDITERKEAERSLRESESRFAAFMDRLPVTAFIKDDRFTNLYVNRHMAQLFGAGGWIGKSVRDLFPADAAEKMIEDDRRTLNEGYLKTTEVLRTTDGDTRFFETRKFRIDREGDSPLIGGFAVDITEPKQAVAALAESESRLRSFIEAAQELIVLIDEDGMVLEWNPAAERLTGMSKAEALGRSIADLTFCMVPREKRTEEHRRAIEQAIRTAHATGIPVFREPQIFEAERPDGARIFFRQVYFPIRTDRGFRFGSLAQDITHERLAEEALRESEEWFRSIAETSPEMIWEIDLQGRFRYISPMIEPLLGYRPDEVIGRPMIELVAEEGRTNAMRELAKHISAGGLRPPLEVSARHRKGHEIVLEIRSTLIEKDGRPDGARGVAVDITERKRTEEALRLATHKLGLLSSITRHDVINKTTIILGYLELAGRKSDDPAVVGLVKKAVSQTLAIQAEMEFAKRYQALGTQKPEWIALDSVMPRDPLPSAIAFRTTLPGVSVFADPMLEQVFANLLGNSIRHGETVTAIRVSARTEDGSLIVAWEDDGVGVAVDEKERIFEQGYGHNSGLGLFLAREILALTGITIREVGDPGRGARFEIKVPQGGYWLSLDARPPSIDLPTPEDAGSPPSP